MRVKSRALRQGVWFKVTSRSERSIVDLAIRCVKRIRSPVLAGFVSEIVRKISIAMGKVFLEIVNKIGGAVAERICAIAGRWGNENASDWRHESGFIRFLGVNAVNNKAASI